MEAYWEGVFLQIGDVNRPHELWGPYASLAYFCQRLLGDCSPWTWENTSETSDFTRLKTNASLFQRDVDAQKLDVYFAGGGETKEEPPSQLHFEKEWNIGERENSNQVWFYHGQNNHHPKEPCVLDHHPWVLSNWNALYPGTLHHECQSTWEIKPGHVWYSMLVAEEHYNVSVEASPLPLSYVWDPRHGLPRLPIPCQLYQFLADSQSPQQTLTLFRAAVLKHRDLIISWLALPPPGLWAAPLYNMKLECFALVTTLEPSFWLELPQEIGTRLSGILQLPFSELTYVLPFAYPLFRNAIVFGGVSLFSVEDTNGVAKGILQRLSVEGRQVSTALLMRLTYWMSLNTNSSQASDEVLASGIIQTLLQHPCTNTSSAINHSVLLILSNILSETLAEGLAPCSLDEVVVSGASFAKSWSTPALARWCLVFWRCTYSHLSCSRLMRSSAVDFLLTLPEYASKDSALALNILGSLASSSYLTTSRERLRQGGAVEACLSLCQLVEEEGMCFDLAVTFLDNMATSEASHLPSIIAATPCFDSAVTLFAALPTHTASSSTALLQRLCGLLETTIADFPVCCGRMSELFAAYDLWNTMFWYSQQMLASREFIVSFLALVRTLFSVGKQEGLGEIEYAEHAATIACALVEAILQAYRRDADVVTVCMHVCSAVIDASKESVATLAASMTPGLAIGWVTTDTASATLPFLTRLLHDNDCVKQLCFMLTKRNSLAPLVSQLPDMDEPTRVALFFVVGVCYSMPALRREQNIEAIVSALLSHCSQATFESRYLQAYRSAIAFCLFVLNESSNTMSAAKLKMYYDKAAVAVRHCKQIIDQDSSIKQQNEGFVLGLEELIPSSKEL